MTATSLSDRVRLAHGIDMPQVGLGVWRTAAQVVLRRELQQGIIVIPKSVRRDRIGTDPDLMQY